MSPCSYADPTSASDSSPSIPSSLLLSLELQVTCLTEKYRAVTALNPSLAELIKRRELRTLFYEVFDHHLAIIKSRSQAFEDGHITVYDKALLLLTDNGNNIHRPGAIELFLEEIIGVSSGGEVGSIDALLSKNVALKTVLWHLSRPEPAKGYEAKAAKSLLSTRDKSPIPKGAGANRQNTAEQTNGHKVSDEINIKSTEDFFSSILATFTAARLEYDSFGDGDVVAKIRAAKFLRDTAENALNYLRVHGLTHNIVPELESAFSMAKDKAEALSGGRKRRFEIHETGQQKEDIRYLPVYPRGREAGSRKFRGSYLDRNGRSVSDRYRPH